MWNMKSIHISSICAWCVCVRNRRSDLKHAVCQRTSPIIPLFFAPTPPSCVAPEKRLIYDICWRRTELWPSPVVHGNSSSACFSRNCASGLRDTAVGSSEEQLWVGKEQNSQSFSSGSPYEWNYGCTGSEGGREAEDKGSDNLWPENLPYSVWIIISHTGLLHYPQWPCFLSKRRPRSTNQV